MSRPKKGAGTNKKGHSERNPRNIEKGETSDSSIERRPETKRHRPESASSSHTELIEAESVDIAPLIVKLKENEQGQKISKVTACLWLSRNYQVQEEMKIMARGDILVKVTNKIHFEDLKALDYINDYPIEVSLPKSLSQFKKVVTLYENINPEEMDQIEIEWKNKYGISKIEKLLKKIEEDLVPTKSLVLYSNVPIPDRVTVGPLSFPARPWTSKPRRCTNCQLFGHIKDVCRTNTQTCGKCACRGHSAENCTESQIKCRNCQSTDHISGDKNCQKYKEIMEISKIVSKNKIPWKEAKMTYAEKTKTGLERQMPIDSTNQTNNSLSERAHVETIEPAQIQKVLKLLIETIKIVSKPKVNGNEMIQEIKRAAETIFPGIINSDEPEMEERFLAVTEHESRT